MLQNHSLYSQFHLDILGATLNWNWSGKETDGHTVTSAAKKTKKVQRIGWDR